jgi:DNA-directed RNA polymerase subunit M/transcription elongation factor TFIIS
MDEPVTKSDFSTGCPACGSPDIRPVTQQNNFTGQEELGEQPLPGAAHVSTSREYECQRCGHRWAETVPHPRRG